MTWVKENVRSPYTAGSLSTVASELAKYNLDVVAVQEVRWANSASQPAGGLYIFIWKGER